MDRLIHSVFAVAETDGWTAMTVELQGTIDSIESVILANRNAALAALRMLRAPATRD